MRESIRRYMRESIRRYIYISIRFDYVYRSFVTTNSYTYLHLSIYPSLNSFEAHGVAREDLTEAWLTGPAFAAWGRMGNVQKWGGPLSFEGFIKPQHELQLQILARMRLLGITPVLPAFAGFLPPAFLPLLPPNASVTR
jgi:hypothetical protein